MKIVFLGLLAFSALNVDALLTATSKDVESTDHAGHRRTTGDAAHKSRRAPGPAPAAATDDTEDDDDSEDDTEDDKCASQEAHVAKVATALAANLHEQTEFQQAIKELSDTAKSTEEMDAIARDVANQTESLALANMLERMWKEMRMFEGPAYLEYTQKELKELKSEEGKLNANLTEAKSELKACTSGKPSEKEGEKNASTSQSLKDEEQNAVKATEDAASKAASASTYSVWEMNSKQRREAITGSIFFLVIGFLAAFVYKKHFQARFLPAAVTDKFPTGQGFTFGLLDCFSVPKLCIFGCCCPCMLWADTLDRKGLLSWWKAFAAFFGLLWLHMYTYGISSLFVIVLGVIFRQKLRTKYQMAKTKDTVCYDLLTWWCCSTCAIIQEAREEGAHPQEISASP